MCYLKGTAHCTDYGHLYAELIMGPRWVGGVTWYVKYCWEFLWVTFGMVQFVWRYDHEGRFVCFCLVSWQEALTPISTSWLAQWRLNLKYLVVTVQYWSVVLGVNVVSANQLAKHWNYPAHIQTAEASVLALWGWLKPKPIALVLSVVVCCANCPLDTGD